MEHDEILDDPGLVALWEVFRLGIGPWFSVLHGIPIL